MRYDYKCGEYIEINNKQYKIRIKKGYLTAGNVDIHVLIWEHFNNQKHPGKEFHIHHKDGNKLNNNPNNLELLTRSKHFSITNFQGGSVRKVKNKNRWIADYKRYEYLGCFKSYEEACEALFKRDPEYWSEEKQIEKLNNK